MSHSGVKSVLLINETKAPSKYAGTVSNFQGASQKLWGSSSCTNHTLGEFESFELVNDKEVKSNCTFYLKGDCTSPAYFTLYGEQGAFSIGWVASYWCGFVSVNNFTLPSG